MPNKKPNVMPATAEVAKHTHEDTRLTARHGDRGRLFLSQPYWFSDPFTHNKAEGRIMAAFISRLWIVSS